MPRIFYFKEADDGIEALTQFVLSHHRSRVTAVDHAMCTVLIYLSVIIRHPSICVPKRAEVSGEHSECIVYFSFAEFRSQERKRCIVSFESMLGGT